MQSNLNPLSRRLKEPHPQNPQRCAFASQVEQRYLREMNPEINAKTAQLIETSKLGKLAALKLIFNDGLYASVDISTDVGRSAMEKIGRAQLGVVDCYCTGCRKETSFIIRAFNPVSRGGGLSNGDRIDKTSFAQLSGLLAVCQRDNTVYQYAFICHNNKLTKVGQWPSVADVAFGELKTIDHSLEEQDRKELGQALGLYSHDAVIGAFAYLRRVFERMIERAYRSYQQAGNQISGFNTLKMDQKIAELREVLPENVVEHSAVFSVLSLGLHELTDEDCRDIFPLMKAVIFQMLEAEEHARQAAIKRRDTDSAFNALLSRRLGLK